MAARKAAEQAGRDGTKAARAVSYTGLSLQEAQQILNLKDIDNIDSIRKVTQLCVCVCVCVCVWVGCESYIHQLSIYYILHTYYILREVCVCVCGFIDAYCILLFIELRASIQSKRQDIWGLLLSAVKGALYASIYI